MADNRNWVHRLSGVDRVNKTATCAACGPVKVYVSGRKYFACAPAQVKRGNERYRRKVLAAKVAAATAEDSEHEGHKTERFESPLLA